MAKQQHCKAVTWHGSSVAGALQGPGSVDFWRIFGGFLTDFWRIFGGFNFQAAALHGPAAALHGPSAALQGPAAALQGQAAALQGLAAALQGQGRGRGRDVAWDAATRETSEARGPKHY